MALLLTAQAVTAGTPTVSDAISSYEKRSQELCGTAHADYTDQVGIWEQIRSNTRASKEWHHDWPLNEHEERAGAFGLVMSAQVGDFIAVLGAVTDEDRKVGFFEDESFLNFHDKASAGLALSKCLFPNQETLQGQRREDARLKLTKSVANAECKNWFEFQRRVLALDFSRVDISDAVEQIGKETIGQCKEKL